MLKLCMRIDLNLMNFSIGPTSNYHCISCYKFWIEVQFESSMNFKGVQTLWEKSAKLTKNLS
jgi:hypothetical protein